MTWKVGRSSAKIRNNQAGHYGEIQLFEKRFLKDQTAGHCMIKFFQ